MARKLLVLGESGTGKSFAARNLNPAETFIICPDEKELPFRGWRKNYKTVLTDKGGVDMSKSNFYMSTDSAKISKAIDFINSSRNDIKIIIIDTISLMMVASFMESASVKGFEKFTNQAVDVWSIFKKLNTLRDDLTVIVNAHTEKDREGATDFFTPGGKLISEKAKPVAMFTVVLETHVEFKNEQSVYSFMTQNNGMNVAKSPEGMFSGFLIPNDYAEVLDAIDKYENGE